MFNIKYYMNKSYLLALSKGTSLQYLTMSNQRGQTRVMCFEHKKDAKRCKDYVIGYKTAYGHWPSLDMSVHEQKIEYKREPLDNNNEIYQQVFIEEITEYTFKNYCNNKKMNFLLCNSFNTIIEGNKHNLDFSGSEFVCDNDNIYSNVKQLNTLYEKF